MSALPNYVSVATLNCQGIKNKHKISVFRQKVQDLEIICLQETHFRDDMDADEFDRTFGPIFKIYHSFTEANNSKTGVSILISRRCPVSDIRQVFEIRGRAIGITLSVGGFSLFLVGLYANSNPVYRGDFFINLLNVITEKPWYDSSSVIVCGDFNFVEDYILDRSNATRDRQAGLNQFLILKDHLSIHDVYREKNPTKNDLFTFTSAIHNTFSRLDRVYCSINIVPDALCTIRSVSVSDHKVFRVRIDLKSATCKRGRGYFKMNTLLLSEYGVDNFVQMRLQYILEHIDQVATLWESFKVEVKDYFQKVGKYKSKERTNKRVSLEDRIKNTEQLMISLVDPLDKNVLKPYLKRLKQELDALNNFYLSSCRHNTYFKDYVQDKITYASAKSLQRKDWEQRHIYSIQQEDGIIVHNPEDIKAVIHDQYQTLFQSDGISYPTLRYFLSQPGFPRLSQDQKNSLEDPISVAEVSDAMKGMQGNKTPGYDSIPIEFYWKFSNDLTRILCALFNSFSVTGKMHDTAYMGIISLLYKGLGERYLRGNWRPLTMLNIDYKIFTKIMAKRLDPVIATLVHPDQTSSVPGRNIQHSLAHVMSVVHYAKAHNAEAMILSVDHQAAFDMVEWPFIVETLRAMNFGNGFIKLIECVYHNGKVNSAVNVNGFVSEFFEVHRGIRQGCPLSPLIYVITSEVLAHFIRQTSMIKGIPLCGTNTRITKYADDTSLFVSKWIEVDSVFRIFTLFKNASGSRLKAAKTQLLLLGNLQNALVPERFQDFVTKRLKLYGFFVTVDGLDDPQNWVKCEDAITKLSRRLPPYGVSLFGKMHHIHIFYLCMFNYIIRLVEPPAPLVRRAKDAIVRFLWFPSRAHIITQNVLHLPPPDGGIGFPDFEKRTKINRLMFYINVMTNKEVLSWRRCFNHFYRMVENVSKRQTAALANVPSFYKEIRIVIIETNFRIMGEFCWFLGEQMAVNTVTAKCLYEKWVKQVYTVHMVPRNRQWAERLGVSEAFVRTSWNWAKTSYVDG
jgi:exonuclease III